MAFDSNLLVSTDLRVKGVLDAYMDTELCGCDHDLKSYIDKLLIIRKGIGLDLAFGDSLEAESKLDLLITFLDGGKDHDCGCN